MISINRSIVEPHLAGTSDLLEIRGCHVVVRLPDGLPTAERGRRLMDLEKTLRREVDVRAEVFLRPMQDRNAVRRFRGVEVKT